jgi:hypothetical protein
MRDGLAIRRKSLLEESLFIHVFDVDKSESLHRRPESALLAYKAVDIAPCLPLSPPPSLPTGSGCTPGLGYCGEWVTGTEGQIIKCWSRLGCRNEWPYSILSGIAVIGIRANRIGRSPTFALVFHATRLRFSTDWRSWDSARECRWLGWDRIAGNTRL